jgi:hypothetical protein
MTPLGDPPPDAEEELGVRLHEVPAVTRGGRRWRRHSDLLQLLAHNAQPQHDSGGESRLRRETPHRCHVGIIQTTQVKG